jgi:type VI secretion system FHA domain protein
MSITFTITNQPAAVPGQELTHMFTEGGTIGRTRTCDWVLIDASRFISGKHAVISSQNGGYQITDTSTNGVFINDSKVPLGKGNSAILNNGDTLKIGEYIIKVAIGQQPAEPAQPASGAQIQPPPDILGDMEGLGEGPIDPLELFKQPKKPQPPSKPVQPRPAEKQGFIPQPEKPPEISSSEQDHAAPVHNHFVPPNIIPDDWLEEEKKPPKNKAPSRSDLKPPPPTEEQPRFVPPKPSEDAIKKPLDIPELTSGTSPAFRKKKPKKPTRPVTGTPSAVSNQVVQAFLTGLGVEGVKLSTDQLPTFMRVLGEVVRECIAGAFNVLRSRTNIKSEFRMSMTTIQAVENNPLKFSVNVDEAIKNMFLNNTESYLPPVDAIREGFEDIEGHQLAVMAGTQAAIVALLGKFDPEYLEETFDKSRGRSSLFGSSKKAKYWDEYKDYYAEIAAQVEDNFQNMFGDEFAQAYENQVQRLLGDRRKRR